MKSGTPTICIIAQNAYGALCRKGGHVGGAELQTALMARWFARKGYRTSLITWNEGIEDGEVVDGVVLRRMCRRTDGFFGWRFVHPRLTSLYSAMRRANADVYYHNSAEYVTGLAAFWCRRRHRKLVYSVAAELACDVRIPLMKKSYERALYRYGVRHADLRIVQTQQQARLLKGGWGLDSLVLPMPCSMRTINPRPGFRPRKPATILWVGRVDRNKRLEWFLDLAERLPAMTFEVAAAVNDAASYAAGLRKRAGKICNVRWNESVSRESMSEIYDRTDVLCCTSMHEGFPNTFLEAWNYGIPVVTTFDPDGLVESLGLGVVAHNCEEMAAVLVSLSETPEKWLACSTRAIRYFEATHAVDVAMPRFEEAILRVSHSRQRVAALAEQSGLPHTLERQSDG